MSSHASARHGISRRAFLAILVCLVATLVCPAAAQAISSPDGYSYEASPLGGAVITGYTGNETQLNVPSVIGGLPVTGIGEKAFSQNHAITEVNIPEGVTTIGKHAFNDCTSLATLSLPGSLTEIGKSAFYTCSSLTTIELPAGVTTIGDYAFTGCLSLTSASIPGSVSSWGTASFAYCDKLATLAIGEGVDTVPERAFKSCTALTTVSLPSSVKTVGRRAFEFCQRLATIDLSHVEEFGYRSFACGTLFNGLTSLDLASATTIGEEAFAGQSKVASIALPCVQSIGKKAFDGTLDAEESNGVIALPATAAQLADGAFQGCGASRIDVDAASTAYKSVEGVVYTVDGSVLVVVPAKWSPAVDDQDKASAEADDDPVTFSPADGTISIAGAALAGTKNIEKIVLPDSITQIGEESFAASSATSVTLSNNLTAIPAKAFYNSSIESIDVPGSVRSIGESAFACPNGLSMLESVTLSEGLQTIGKLAFGDCSSLKSISLPSTLTSVDPLAFYDTRGLESVTLAEGGVFSLKDGNLLTDGGATLVHAFPIAADQATKTYRIPDGVTHVGTLALEAVDAYTTYVPDSATAFDEMAMGYCYTSKGTYGRQSTTKFFGSANNTGLTNYLSENNLAFFTAEPTTSCTELTLAAGETGTFTLSGSTSDFVVYASSDNSVASIDQNGVVTAVAGGEADVFACVSQLYFSAHVTVTGEAAQDPYASYATIGSTSEADAWGSAYETYNNGASPTSITTPSIYLYTTDNYPAINALLDETDFKEMADGQYGAGEYGEFADAGQNSASELGQYAVHEDTVVWSGLEHSGFVPGGIADLSNVIALIGQEVTFQPITSTSLLRSVAVRFASTADTPTIIQVYVPQGTKNAAYIGLHSAASDERELTIAPGAALKVLDAGVAYFPKTNPFDPDSQDAGEKVAQRYIKLVLLEDSSDDQDDSDADTPDDTTPDAQPAGDNSGEKTDAGGGTPATSDATVPVTGLVAAGLALLAIRSRARRD